MTARLLSILLTVLLVRLASGQSTTTSTAKRDDILRLLAVTKVEAQTKLVLSQTITEWKRALPEVTASEWAELQKELRVEELISIAIPIYEKHFTHDEIKGLLEFYESPLGKKTLEKMPLVTAECMEAGIAWGRKIGATIEEKHARRAASATVISPQDARRAQISDDLRRQGLNPADYDIDATIRAESEQAAKEAAAAAKRPKAHYRITVGQGKDQETYLSEKEPKRIGNAYKIKDVRGFEIEVSGTVKILKLPD